MRWLLQHRDPHKPCTSAETSRTNTHRDVKPFGKNQLFLSVDLRDLQESDTAGHRENSHEQLLMHSVAVFSKQPVKDAVTDPPALPGEDPCTKPSDSFSGSFSGLEWLMAGPTGVSCSPPAWPCHWGTEEPDSSPAVPIFGATREHHCLQLLVHDSLIFSMLFKIKSSLISNNISTSGGTTLNILIASLFRCPSVERRTRGQAC